MHDHQKQEKSMTVLSVMDILIVALPKGFFVLCGCLAECEGRQTITCNTLKNVPDTRVLIIGEVIVTCLIGDLLCMFRKAFFLT